jgi:glucose-1-phosphate thymidylyltransferase
MIVCDRPAGPHTDFGLGPAPLVPVANTPLIIHALHALRDAGVDEPTVFADCPDRGAMVRALNERCPTGVQVLDGNPRAWKAHDGDPVILIAADALPPDRLSPLVDLLRDGGPDAIFVTAVGDGEGRPGDADPLVALLAPQALEVLSASTARPGGDQLIRHALLTLTAAGRDVALETSPRAWRWNGRTEDLLDANRSLLDELAATSGADGRADQIRVQGRVLVDPTASVESCTLRGPCMIGPRARLHDSYIGPYTAIGADAVVEGAEIEHSMILAGARIHHPGRRLESSLIGPGARVFRSYRLPDAVHLRVGARAEIELA